MHTGKDLEAH